jgi:uncharacterized protein (UPF0335 family)
MPTVEKEEVYAGAKKAGFKVALLQKLAQSRNQQTSQTRVYVNAAGTRDA